MVKLQELLTGPKPSPTRAARSAPAEGSSAGFADALSEARKKPQSKPAEKEAPVAKKPVASKSKKAKGPKEEPAPAEDVATAAEQPDERATTQTASEAEEPIESDGSAPVAEDADANAESDAVPVVKADLSAVAAAQPMGPFVITPSSETPSSDSEAAEDSSERPICPSGRVLPRVGTALLEGSADGVETEGSVDSSATTGATGIDATVFDEIDDGDAENDPSLEGALPSPIARRSVAPLGTPEGADEPSSDAVATDEKSADAPTNAVAGEFPLAVESDDANAATSRTSTTDVKSDTTIRTSQQVQAESPRPTRAPAPPPAAVAAPQAHFVEQNHAKIVTAVRGELLPNGGSMQIRLDPPELGALFVSVQMQDGAMTAAFHTTSDDATRLLSHSLSQLKQVLESQGVSVEKLHVQQSPRDQQAASDDQRQQQRDQQDDAHRQEQQRKEMLRRMWRRLANGSDPLDLVA